MQTQRTTFGGRPCRYFEYLILLDLNWILKYFDILLQLLETDLSIQNLFQLNANDCCCDYNTSFVANFTHLCLAAETASFLIIQVVISLLS